MISWRAACQTSRIKKRTKDRSLGGIPPFNFGPQFRSTSHPLRSEQGWQFQFCLAKIERMTRSSHKPWLDKRKERLGSHAMYEGLSLCPVKFRPLEAALSSLRERLFREAWNQGLGAISMFSKSLKVSHGLFPPGNKGNGHVFSPTSNTT